MKKIIAILILIFSFHISLFAQEFPFLSKGLHQMEDKELNEYKAQFTADTPMYDEQGNTIKNDQINDLLRSGNFVPVIYGDKDHNVQAVIFRKATQEEKEEFKKWMQQQDPNANFKPGEPAPDFETTDINGKTVKLSDLKGKIVVINFWFTTCPPCVAEIPELNKIASKYKKSSVEFLAITFENKDKVAPFLKKHPFYFDIITDAKIIRKYNIIGFPTSLIIDKEGKIMFKKTGVFTAALEKTLALYVDEK